MSATPPEGREQLLCKGHELRGFFCLADDCQNRRLPNPREWLRRQRRPVALDDFAQYVGRWAGYGSVYASDPLPTAVVIALGVFFRVVLDGPDRWGLDLPDDTDWSDYLAYAVLDALEAAGFAVVPVELLPKREGR